MNIEDLSTVTLTELDELPILLSSDYLLISRDTDLNNENETVVQSYKVRLSAYIQLIVDRQYVSQEQLALISSELFELIDELDESVLHKDVSEDELLENHCIQVASTAGISFGDNNESMLTDATNDNWNKMQHSTKHSSGKEAQINTKANSLSSVIELIADKIDVAGTMYSNGVEVATKNDIGKIGSLPEPPEGMTYALEEWTFKQTPTGLPFKKYILVAK